MKCLWGIRYKKTDLAGHPCQVGEHCSDSAGSKWFPNRIRTSLYL